MAARPRRTFDGRTDTTMTDDTADADYGADADIDPFEEYSPTIDQDVYRAQFEQRNEQLRLAIEAAATYDGDMDDYGAKADAARSVGVPPHRVQYVTERWSHLIEWYRVNSVDPTDKDELEAIYDEYYGGMGPAETPATEGTTANADGGDGVMLTFKWDVNRAMRMLGIAPNDMKRDMVRQMMAQSDEMPRDQLLRAFETSE